MSLGSLVATVSILATGPAPAVTPTRSMSHHVLRDHCLLWAADPKNPWALAHGITGLGASYLAADGRKADVVMVHDFLLRNPKGPEAGGPYAFATYAPDATPIEPHPNLICKTLVLGGVPRSTAYATQWKQKVSLQQLVDSVKRGYRHVPLNPEYWKSVAWTLDVLTHTTSPGGTIATDAGPVKIDQVMDDALTALEAATADLKAGLDQGLPQIDKRKQAGAAGHHSLCPCTRVASSGHIQFQERTAHSLSLDSAKAADL